MPPDQLYARIVTGDEDALREVWRSQGTLARNLARRIGGPVHAAAIVEECVLLIWTEPKRWAADPLDLHLLRLVRDLALIVRKRGLAPRLAVRQLEPFRAGMDADASGLAAGLVATVDREACQRMLLQLSDRQREALETGWFEGLGPAALAEQLRCSEAESLHALGEALDQLAVSIRDHQ